MTVPIMFDSPTRPSLFMNFLTGSLDPRITFTRASTAVYFDVTGTMQTAASNAPRFDYDPVSHAALGLMIEEARTNLLLNSAALSTQMVMVTAVATTLSFYGTGTITLTGASTAGPLVGSGAFPTRVSLTFTPSAGVLMVMVSGSVLMAQLEVGSTMTSYIATAGATATRAAETPSLPFTPTYPFSLFGEAMVTKLGTPNASGVAVFTDGTTSNRMAIRANALAQSTLGALYVAGGTNTAVPATVNTIVAGAVFKVGAVATTAGLTLCGNGGALVTVAGAAPTGLNLLTLGATSTPANALNGWLRRIRYWPRPLSDAELQRATT